MTFVFTFPVSDPVRCDSYMVVEAPDETTARLDVISRYGRDGWAFCYSPDDAKHLIAKYDLTRIEIGA